MWDNLSVSRNFNNEPFSKIIADSDSPDVPGHDGSHWFFDPDTISILKIKNYDMHACFSKVSEIERLSLYSSTSHLTNKRDGELSFGHYFQ